MAFIPLEMSRGGVGGGGATINRGEPVDDKLLFGVVRKGKRMLRILSPERSFFKLWAPHLKNPLSQE